MTLKDPDGVAEFISAATDEFVDVMFPNPKMLEDGYNNEFAYSTGRGSANELVDRYFKNRESVTIEFDTETGEARIHRIG
jgi:hypothetical protein